MGYLQIIPGIPPDTIYTRNLRKLGCATHDMARRIHNVYISAFFFSALPGEFSSLGSEHFFSSRCTSCVILFRLFAQLDIPSHAHIDEKRARERHVRFVGLTRFFVYTRLLRIIIKLSVAIYIYTSRFALPTQIRCHARQTSRMYQV